MAGASNEPSTVRLQCRLHLGGHARAVRGFISDMHKLRSPGIRGKGTGAAQFPTESVTEELAREQWQGDHGR